MKNGLAAWHYPHRTVVENVRFFAEHGFESVSLLGYHMDDVCKDAEQSRQLAGLVRETGVILTVHHKLPLTHAASDVADFEAAVCRMAAWQQQYGLMHILSFDVHPAVRDNVLPYVRFVLAQVPGSLVALEDFGLNETELRQLEELKAEPRFGHLIDIGHMYLRMHSQGINPGCEDFLREFTARELPICEMHLHNNDGLQDLHLFLEDGTLDISAVAAALHALRYEGILTIESAPGYQFPCVYPESDERILATRDYWESLCGAAE